MGVFFKSNDFKIDYKKRPHDEYKAMLDKLDEETKKKFDRQRALILAAVLGVVVIGIIILAVTGFGTNTMQSAGNILAGEERAVINCLGDSLTLGTEDASWPESMKKELEQRLGKEVTVNNYGSIEGKAENTSYKGMNETADIAILLYTYENFEAGEDPEGILEANVDGLMGQESLVYLVNYPVSTFAQESSALRQANQYIAKVSKERDILLLDASAYFSDLLNQGYTEAELFEADGFHLSSTGYELLGVFLADGLISDAQLQ